MGSLLHNINFKDETLLFGILPWETWLMTTVVLIAGLSFFLRFIDKRKAQSTSTDKSCIMRSPASFLIVAILWLILFTTMTIISQISPDVNDMGVPEVNPWYTAAFLALDSVGVFFIFNYFVEHYIIQSDRLIYRTIHRRGTLCFAEISNIKYSQNMKWFKITNKEGAVIRISVALTNQCEFAKTILKNVDMSCMDESTHSTLKAFANGKMISIWD